MWAPLDKGDPPLHPPAPTPPVSPGVAGLGWSWKMATPQRTMPDDVPPEGGLARSEARQLKSPPWGC